MTTSIDPAITPAELKNAQILIAHMICDLIRIGQQAAAEEAIRQGLAVGQRLGPYPASGEISEIERETLANIIPELH